MADFNTSKIDGAGNTVAAAEWNQFADIDNFIITSGQTPASGDLNQLGIAAARYSSGGQFYTDSGTANAYVLTPVSPFKAPVYATNTYFDGMIIRFRAGNANTGASTININSVGAKDLQKENGSALTAGDIQPYSDVAFRYNGTAFVKFSGNATITSKGQTFLSNPITIANNATTPNTDIDFTAGVFQFNDGTGQAVSTAMTKRLQSSGSWSAGTAGNMLLTGAKANSSTYHLYAIYNPATGVSDYGALLGIAGTAPDPTSVLPSGYTKFRRVGSILTDASGNILAFTCRANYVEYAAPVLALTGASQGINSETLRTINIPLGVAVRANVQISAGASSAGSGHIKIYSPYQTQATLSGTDGYGYVSNGVTNGLANSIVLTNKSAQVKTNFFANTGSPTITVAINVMGYEDLTL